MNSDSIFKDIVRGFFGMLFRIIGIGVGIVIFFAIFGALFKTPPTVRPTTVATIMPDHNWKQAPFSNTTPTIVEIAIDGVIGMDHLTQSAIRSELIDTIDGDVKQGQVKGVLLRINTPGGTVEDSDGIYRILLEYKKRLQVPVYAHVDGFCASGGMYIACAADKIYATEASLVGHVGVLLPTIFNFSVLMDHLGIASKTITAGKNKDALNPFRPWTENEGASFQYITESMYKTFVDIVSTARPLLTKESLIEQGAQIYPVENALKLGYIDGTVSSIDESLLKLVTDLGIEKEYQVVEMRYKNWLEDLFDGNQALVPNKMTHELKLPALFSDKLYGKFLYMYVPEQTTTHD